MSTTSPDQDQKRAEGDTPPLELDERDAPLSCLDCGAPISNEGMDLSSSDLVRCRVCGELCEISELVHKLGKLPVDPSRPPSGVWFKETFDGFILGASTRSSVADSLMRVPFSIAWLATIVYGIGLVQSWKEEKIPAEGIVASLLLLGASMILVLIATMVTRGRVVVKVADGEGTIFRGFGPIGFRKRFSWSAVRRVVFKRIKRKPFKTIRRKTAGAKAQYMILLVGDKTTDIGVWLNDDRKRFMNHMLKRMLNNQSKPRKVFDVHDFA